MGEGEVGFRTLRKTNAPLIHWEGRRQRFKPLSKIKGGYVSHLGGSTQAMQKKEGKQERERKKKKQGRMAPNHEEQEGGRRA